MRGRLSCAKYCIVQYVLDLLPMISIWYTKHFSQVMFYFPFIVSRKIKQYLIFNFKGIQCWGKLSLAAVIAQSHLLWAWCTLAQSDEVRLESTFVWVSIINGTLAKLSLHCCQPIIKRRKSQYVEYKLSSGGFVLCPDKIELTGQLFLFIYFSWVDKCVCRLPTLCPMIPGLWRQNTKQYLLLLSGDPSEWIRNVALNSCCLICLIFDSPKKDESKISLAV